MRLARFRRSRCGGSPSGGLGEFCHGRPFRDDLVGWLVLAQSLERSLAYVSAVGKACKFDFGDEFGLQPMDVAGLARRILAAERILVRLGRLQRGHEPPDRILSKAGADHSDKGEMIAAVNAGHQRAEFAVGGLPSTEHNLLAGAAFGFGPAFRTTGAIKRAKLL